MGLFKKPPAPPRHDDWQTPDEIFKPLNDIFEFALDAAASDSNAKCSMYYTEKNSALKQKVSWYETCMSCTPEYTTVTVWLNPPYKDITPWVQQAEIEAKRGCTVVMLLPNSRDTKWYHDLIVPAKRAGYCTTYSRKGRIQFVDPHPGEARTGPKQGNMLVIFRPPLPPEWSLD